MSSPSVAIVAIAKNEDNFIEEWVAYHRLLGINHFYIYDNNRKKTLKKKLNPFKEFVTVSHVNQSFFAKNSMQLRVYTQSLKIIKGVYDWVVFLDIDEFINLKKHTSIQSFLAEYSNVDSIKLHWKIFGHNGFFDTPSGFVLGNYKTCSSLHTIGKTIVRPEKISQILLHFILLKDGAKYVNVLKESLPFQTSHQPNKAMEEIAYIHHYQCRSYTHFMAKRKRGTAHSKGLFVLKRKNNSWRHKRSSVLQMFVEKFAFQYNMSSDNSLCLKVAEIKQFLKQYQK